MPNAGSSRQAHRQGVSIQDEEVGMVLCLHKCPKASLCLCVEVAQWVHLVSHSRPSQRMGRDRGPAALHTSPSGLHVLLPASASVTFSKDEQPCMLYGLKMCSICHCKGCTLFQNSESFSSATISPQDTCKHRASICTASGVHTHIQPILLQHFDALIKGQAQRLGKVLQRLKWILLIDHCKLFCCTCCKHSQRCLD